jgi:hypothetical protein
MLVDFPEASLYFIIKNFFFSAAMSQHGSTVIDTANF